MEEITSREEEEECDPMAAAAAAAEEEEEKGSERMWRSGKGGGGVTLVGFVVDGAGGGEQGPGRFTRTMNLTDEDLEELKGCLDLGFGFSYEEIPELCNTLPALELCYSMSQSFHLDDQHRQQRSPDGSSGDGSDRSPSPASPPVANWRIFGPGDDPDEVKARLKYWAQAVACTVRLCS